MAWLPIGGIVPQATENGNQANGMVLKFYEPGTLAPLAMATDNTGATQTVEFILDTQGYTTLSTVRLIPHAEQIYKVALYLDQTDADANDTGSAVFVVDNVDSVGSLSVLIGKSSGNGIHFDNLAEAMADVDSLVSIGDFLRISERATGSGTGSGQYKKVSVDPGNNLVNPATADGNWLELQFDSGFINVTQAGATGDGSTNDQPSIQAAIDTKKNVYFQAPSASYRIESGIASPQSGGDYEWLGDGRGGLFSVADPDSPVSTIQCIGTNGGVPFLNTPHKISGLRILGDAKQGTGLNISLLGIFQAPKNWDEIHVEGFSIGVFGYNWFNMTWSNSAITKNDQGIRIDPGDEPGDDGFFTATNWENMYIADNDSFGLYIDVPQGAKTFSWENVVIERNGLNTVDPQIRLISTVISAEGAYFEGSAGVPVMSMFASQFYGRNCNIAATGVIDFTSSNNTLHLIGETCTNIINVPDVDAAVIYFDGVFNADFDPLLLGRNVRYTAFNTVTDDGSGGTIRNFEEFHAPMVGQGLNSQKASQMETIAFKRSNVASSTINAGVQNRIIQNLPVFDLFGGANIATAYATLQPNGVDGTGAELILSVSGPSTGGNNDIDVYAFNPTAGNITLTSRDINICFMKGTDET